MPGLVRREPDYRPYGIRGKGGVNLEQNAKDKGTRGDNPEAEVTDVRITVTDQFVVA